MKVLIIEDDVATIDAVSLAFEFRWPEASIIFTTKGDEGAGLVERETPDVVILDLGLPDVDGMDVLRRIRQFSDVPVVILTGRVESQSVVRGLELGADDYVSKPFEPMVLLARVKSVLRRTSMPELKGDEGRLAGNGLLIDLAARQASVGGEPIRLTATEWVLLTELVRNEGRVVSGEKLAQRLWGGTVPDDASTIRKYVSRLRAKLGDNPANPRLILTVHGSGYRFIRPRT